LLIGQETNFITLANVKRLKGKIALVAGATRGAGRGIARALGEQGAVVYCTGRSSRRHPGRGLPGRPETIEETAEIVEKAGGVGIAAQVDHGREDQVRRLLRRIDRERGRLDILVNDIWGGEKLTEWDTPFWRLEVEKGLEMVRRALFTHWITSRHAIPLLLKSKRGLIAEITDGEGLYYRGSFFYDIAKTAVIRTAFALSEELAGTKVAAIAVTPGFLRSEEMLAHFGVTEANWRDAGKKVPHFLESETPLFVGRGLARLAAEKDTRAITGRVYSSWKLARRYKFLDADGRRPDWGRYFDTAPGVKTYRESFRRTHAAFVKACPSP
jgi:NAD(P)-dependent dehydrogenase (short-subunit alcohol dehydrogenase family)